MREKAAALAYDQSGAPKVVAKGTGEVARKIIEQAIEYGIPIQKDEVLVETLMRVEYGEEIPPQLYQIVAELLAFVYRLDKLAKDRTKS
ncbi:Flagellar biosynthetic protein FlhB [bioreactor metagenome]|uniref:Flagellar biosynthetic protein FlhB n=1 Tax=bioreactor metagenome TaxID=1076179 RepID=A0A644WNY9_9ZZZZ|nr:EscU/YscU/HrcU family type III secretion system export apparatus switch protein [Desulfitobacterium hafniense]MEA5025877.1 EscU/YscU/HrcU family type III secretion system export apparatus switch protein [Desulfitobacterium hafniense]